MRRTRARCELLEKLLGRPALAGEVFLVALADVLPDLRVPALEVILELVNVHQARDRDAVLFEDDVLLVEVDPLDQGAEVYAGLGQGGDV